MGMNGEMIHSEKARQRTWSLYGDVTGRLIAGPIFLCLLCLHRKCSQYLSLGMETVLWWTFHVVYHATLA